MLDRLKFTTAPIAPMNKKQLQVRDQILKGIVDGTYKQNSVSCVCGEEKNSLVSERERHGFPYNYLMCDKCGIIRCDPQFDDSALENLYSSDLFDSLAGIKGIKERTFTDQSLSRGSNMLSTVLKTIDLESNSVVYEIGCGTGGVLYKFFEKGYKVAGCDLCDETLFDYGRSKGMDLIQGDHNVLEELGKADLIIFSHVVEHLPRPLEVLQDIKKLLKPTGHLFIAIPGVLDPKNNCGHNYASYFTISHLFHYSAKNLSMMLNMAGYQVEFVDERIHCLAKVSIDDLKEIDASDQAGLIDAQIQKSELLYFKNPLLRRIRISLRKVTGIRKLHNWYH